MVLFGKNTIRLTFKGPARGFFYKSSTFKSTEPEQFSKNHQILFYFSGEIKPPLTYAYHPTMRARTPIPYTLLRSVRRSYDSVACVSHFYIPLSVQNAIATTEFGKAAVQKRAFTKVFSTTGNSIVRSAAVKMRSVVVRRLHLVVSNIKLKPKREGCKRIITPGPPLGAQPGFSFSRRGEETCMIY